VRLNFVRSTPALSFSGDGSTEDTSVSISRRKTMTTQVEGDQAAGTDQVCTIAHGKQLSKLVCDLLFPNHFQFSLVAPYV